ncbi:hypothetical protein Bpfe_023575 [Biomphalaria pfeifferi]|uniref:Uncharacterized protein n=1 Tax=Biomphalaria pfeifferi TaxID=112525 RepID=A0AAD8B2V7_BIOPF|nr:hypothetical protein Bpfe_023575 [Biomphalaria pfeifferi]
MLRANKLVGSARDRVTLTYNILMMSFSAIGSMWAGFKGFIFLSHWVNVAWVQRICLSQPLGQCGLGSKDSSFSAIGSMWAGFKGFVFLSHWVNVGWVQRIRLSQPLGQCGLGSKDSSFLAIGSMWAGFKGFAFLTQ